MTFKLYRKVNLVVALAILAALLVVPLMGVAASHTVASNELFETNSAETIRTDVNSDGIAIACNCPDPGGSSGGCC